MPLEINEISISMRVPGGAGVEDAPALPAAGAPHGPDREELIQECVNRVLKALRNSRER